MVKEFLSQKGINYRELDVSRDRAAAQEMVSRTGQRGVPVTVIDGKIIIGFDRPRLEVALSQTEEKQRLSFGAAIADASKITARTGSGITFGAFIGNVRPGSIAEMAGLKPGDIITEFNLQRINNADDLEQALSRLNKGSRFSIVFLRGNETIAREGIF